MASDKQTEKTGAQRTGQNPAAGRGPSKTPEDKSADRGAETEIGGRKGPDPTRYGDWEINGRCVDF